LGQLVQQTPVVVAVAVETPIMVVRVVLEL
jgi:hypothetical protein